MIRGGAKRKVLLPKPVKGELEGYSTHLSAKSRRSKLVKLSKKKGYATVVRELNIRATVNKRNKVVSKKMRDDMKYLKKNRSKIGK